MDWQSIELSGYTYYSKKGYRILVPLVNNEGLDFVAEKDGEFIRTNVKTAHLKDRKDPNSWCISQASGGSNGHRKISRCDIYLVWFPPLSKFFELPGDFLESGNSKSKRIPASVLALL